MNKPEPSTEVSDMLKARICPGCGAEIRAGAPEDLCPRCLLGLGLGLDPGQASARIGRPASPCDNTWAAEARLFGDYELLEEVARGGMGVVYRARQISLNRIVAVKVLLFGQFASTEFVKRFRAEAEAVASLSHPNIVGIFAVGKHQDQHYFSMEFIEGTNLAGLVREKPLPARQAASLVKILAEGVAYAHGRGILHRDLKPSNVLIDLGGQPHITDFGLAKRLTNDVHITLTGQIFGSPGYMAPEQADPGRGQVGPACDIYSLGAILYYLLTCRPPFVAESVETTLAQVLAGEVLPPRKLNLTLPLDIETICLKCLERDPKGRYGTAQELADELDRFSKGLPIHARSIGPAEKVWRWSARNPLISGLSAAVLLLLAAFVAYSLFSSGRIRLEATRARQAQQQAMAELCQSYLAQARAERRSGQAGQRYASLEAIRRATAIHPSLELRNEAIAALALLDVRVTQKWPHTDSRLVVGYSDSLKRFAVQREDGQISVCLASNGMELARMPAVGHYPRWIAGFTPDEKLLAVNYYDDVNYVWDVEARKTILGPVPGLSCAFLPSTNQLLVSGADSTFSFYSLDTGKPVRSASLPEPLPALVTRPRSGLIGGFRHGSTVFHLLDYPECTERFALEHPAQVGSAALSWDGESAAVGCYDKKIYVWNAKTGERRAILQGHENTVIAVGFNHAGSLLATASWDDIFRLWDTASWQQVLLCPGMSYEMKFGPEDSSLAHLQHGGFAGTLEIAHSAEFRQLHVQPETHQQGWCVALSPDGHLLATAHTDGVALRDAITGAALAWLPVGQCRSVMFVPDGSGLITSGVAGLAFWPIRFSQSGGKDEFDLGERRLIRAELQFMAATLSGDGRWVAAANRPAGAVAIYEVAHPANRFALTNFANVQFVSATPDMHWLAAGTWGSTGVNVWNVFQRRLESTLPVAGSATVAFSGDGALLATGSTRYEVWQAGTWRKLYEVPKPDSETSGLAAFSPDSRWLAVLEGGRDIALVEAHTGAALATLEAPHQPGITAFCFSTDGSKLVALQSDQTLQIWDLRAVRRELAALNLDW